MTIEAPGIERWRAIFLVEGLLTMGIAVVAFFLIKDNPDQAPFLTEDDKEKLRALHEQDRPNESTEFSWDEVREAFTSGYIWVSTFQLYSTVPC